VEHDCGSIPSTRRCEPEVPIVFPRLKVAAKVVGDLNRKARKPVCSTGADQLVPLGLRSLKGDHKRWAGLTGAADVLAPRASFDLTASRRDETAASAD